MSGLQDENSFSAGGGTQDEKKKEVRIVRPDPGAVKATVDGKIAQVKQSTADAKKTAKDAHADKKSRIVGAKLDQIDGAADKRDDAIDNALKPVIAQDQVIAELERQLAQARLDRAAKSVVFSAKKGELKTAYKQAVAAIKDTAAGHLANVEAKRDGAYEAAEKALEIAKSEGANVVAKEKELAALHDNWQSQMKWEGRKAGFNAVAATVKAIVEAVQTTYRDNRDLARSNVEIPAALLERQNGGPTPPAQS